MKFSFALTLFLCFAVPLYAEMTDKEMIAVINKVQRAYLAGNKDSLEELQKLPTNTAVPALLPYFNQNFQLFRPDAKKEAEARRIAKLILDLPGIDGFIKGLLKISPSKNPGWILHQRNGIIDMLIFVHNKTSVRLFADLLNDPDNALPDKDLGRFLALLNIPGAPFSKETQKEAITPEGMKRWKEWWETNKGDYPELTK